MRIALLPVLPMTLSLLYPQVSAADVKSLLIKRAAKYQAAQNVDSDFTRAFHPDSYSPANILGPSSTSAWQPSLGGVGYRVNSRRLEASYLHGETLIRMRFDYDGDAHLELNWPDLVANGELKFGITEDSGKAHSSLEFSFAF